jgi:hypothetical protein
MRQKGERLKKLVRLLPNDGQGRFDMEAPFREPLINWRCCA